MEEENKQDKYIIYKVNTVQTYKIYRSSFADKDYYKIMVAQKNYDDSTVKFYVQVKFKKGLPLPNDGAVIKINKAIETFYTNNRDKYNPIAIYTILDYEQLANDKIDTENALNEYANTLFENESNSNGEPVIEESQLPF